MFVTLNWIVDAFNVLKDFKPYLLSYFINPLFGFFTLQITEERSLHCVVIAVFSSAHTWALTILLKPAVELIKSKLRALVRVKDH
jgi:hypothetical protein